ncbi:MAG: hypothetical protein M1814_002523 [Vezdaea aestivalis]|nr:MAG: hypothetical protein M1814_002523 [Vezdaea aestivalis]
MKFGHEYQQTLSKAEFPYDFPQEWVASAISYRLLKKCVQKLSLELRVLGFDITTLSSLIETDSSGQAQLLSYSLGPDSQRVQPRLALVLESENGVPVDAYLSQETLDFLKQIGLKSNSTPNQTLEPSCNENASTKIAPRTSSHSLLSTSLAPQASTPAPSNNKTITKEIQTLEIPLMADSEFFQMLASEIFDIDRLQVREAAKMKEQISGISDSIVKDTSGSSSDGLYNWREMLDLYLQAGIFFSSNEAGHGNRKPAKAWNRMQWFDAQLKLIERNSNMRFLRSGPVQKFFLLNRELLRSLHFQEINHRAMIKILKKFNKKTALPARREFPALIVNEKFFSSTTAMSKAVCFAISSEILGLVPILDDYLCLICFSIVYKPVRLSCCHLFCISCTLKLQMARDDACPLCRAHVVLKADGRYIDQSHKRFLEKFFPREIKAKQKENERAANPALYSNKKEQTCVVC